MVESNNVANDRKFTVRISIRSIVHVLIFTVIAFALRVLLGVTWHGVYPDAYLLLSWPVYVALYACIMRIFGISKDRVLRTCLVMWLAIVDQNVSDAREELSYSPQFNHLLSNITNVIPTAIEHFAFYAIVSLLVYFLITNTHNALSYYVMIMIFYIEEPFRIVYRYKSVNNMQLINPIQFYISDAYATFITEMYPIAFVFLFVHFLNLLINVAKFMYVRSIKFREIFKYMQIYVELNSLSWRSSLNVNLIVIIVLFAVVNYGLVQYNKNNVRSFVKEVYSQESVIKNDVSAWLFNNHKSIDHELADVMCIKTVASANDIRNRLCVVHHNSDLYLYGINSTLKYGGSRVYENDKIEYTAILVYNVGDHNSECDQIDLYIIAIKCNDSAKWVPLWCTSNPKFMNGTGRDDFIFNDESGCFIFRENGG